MFYVIQFYTNVLSTVFDFSIMMLYNNIPTYHIDNFKRLCSIITKLARWNICNLTLIKYKINTHYLSTILHNRIFALYTNTCRAYSIRPPKVTIITIYT